MIVKYLTGLLVFVLSGSMLAQTNLLKPEEEKGNEQLIDVLLVTPPTLTLPSPPILNYSNIGNTTVDLSWVSGDSNLIINYGYKVYADGVLVTTLGNVSSYQVSGLLPSTAYSFKVSAIDELGAESEFSNEVSVVTSSISEGNIEGYWSLNNEDIYYNSGNVGIGTDVPDVELQVIGSIKAGLSHIRDNGLAKISIGSKWGNWMSFVDSYSNDQYGFHNPNNGGRMQMYIYNGETETYNFGVFTIDNSGKIGIGTTTPDHELTVKGIIHTQEVKVDLEGAIAPDYVFYKDYKLKPLVEVQKYIEKEGHLPNIPSAKKMKEDGINLKEMNLKLLEKIEELTLYTMQQEELLNFQYKLIKSLEDRLIKLEKN